MVLLLLLDLGHITSVHAPTAPQPQHCLGTSLALGDCPRLGSGEEATTPLSLHFSLTRRPRSRKLWTH